MFKKGELLIITKESTNQFMAVGHYGFKGQTVIVEEDDIKDDTHTMISFVILRPENRKDPVRLKNHRLKRL